MSPAVLEFLWRRRWVLSALVIAGALALAPSANFTDIDNDISAWISRSDPLYRDYDRLRHEFGGSRTLIVAIAGDGIFTRAGLEFLRDITADIERVETVQRVQSLATANTVEAIPATADDDGGLEVRPILDEQGLDEPDLVRRRALDDPLLRRDLVSEDGRVTAVIVTFDEDRIDEIRGEIIERVHAIVDPRLPPGLRAYYNGSIEISETYNRVTLANQQRFTPPILLVTIAALYAMFRSARQTALVMGAIFVSFLWTLGLYAAMGFTYNVLTSMIVPLVLLLAIADDVHIVQHYGAAVRAGMGPEAAFKSTVSHMWLPLFAASGTTALGMLSLATSQVEAVRTFGIGAAVGVMVDFAVSLVLVPTLLARVKPDLAPPPQERAFLGPMRAVVRLTTLRPGLVFGGAAVIATIGLAGITRLKVDTNHINFFSERHPLHQSAEVIDRDLSGVYTFQIFLEGPPESMRSPDTLARIEALGHDLEGLESVRKVISLADYVKRIDGELSDAPGAGEHVPAAADLIAQELFVFSLSDEGRRELDRIVASDYSRTQIWVKLASLSSDLVFEQIRRAEALAAARFAGTGITPTVTGSGRLFATLDHYVVRSQVSSFGTAFVTVFGVIFIVFRSIRFGLLAILPNMFPVVVVLGAMGWAGISLNIATVMVASVALGIVDDDTIHFISRYRRETAAGATTDEAIGHATTEEGRAAFTTTIINGFGFAVLGLSEYRPSGWFGGLLALTMFVAFLAEVFILPATIKLLPRVYGAESLRERAAGPGWRALVGRS